MDKIAGPKVTRHMKDEEFEPHAKTCKAACLEMFDAMANMGRASAIAAMRQELVTDVDEEYVRYKTVNAQRNPFKNIEYYIVPLALAAVAFILQWVADLSCSDWSDTCSETSHALGHIYIGIIAFMVIMSAGTILGVMQHLKKVSSVMLGAHELSSSSKKNN
uniref:Uncharacterized protein n=1 Tax=Fibrocapsa japonica TaxID=94617 RepID=A0A7S2XX59_9STRA